MSNKLLKDYLDEGGNFDGPLLVKSCDKGVANNGSNYLTINLQDISASINAKKWFIETGDAEIIVPGSVVRVVGNIFKYRGQNQLKVEEIHPMEKGTYDLNDFYVSCPINDEDLYKQVDELCEMIQDSDIKALVSKVINDNLDKYMTYPAAVSVHHAYRCGIVYHSLSICKDAIAICNLYPQLNKDYMIAGSLLHDIGKTVEMSGINATSYTLIGNLEGHISIGAHLVSKAGEEIKTPEDKLAVVVHMILSHHGLPEYGAAVLPKTPEAYVLHILDDLDSKMFVLEAALKDLNVGEFSPRLPFMEGRSFLKTK